MLPKSPVPPLAVRAPRGAFALLLLLVVAGVAIPRTSAQHLPLPGLQYDYDALEPVISKEALRLHHLGHHQAYTDKLNKALKTLRSDPSTKYLAKMGISALMLHLDEIPNDQGLRTAVTNNGGGYLNHEFFWNSMRPYADGRTEAGLSGDLARALEKHFGSFGEFKEAFGNAAGSLFGSGYAWLVLDNKSYSLVIEQLPNQDSPLSVAGQSPLLALDVWEHAYYVDYTLRRKDYVAEWWNVVNWPEVSRRYEEAMVANGGSVKGHDEL